MKILVISDTHGHAERLGAVLHAEGPADVLVHCGDLEGQRSVIEKTAGCPCYMVAGNCDTDGDLPKEILTEIGGLRFYIVHGHRLGVGFSLERLRLTALEKRADVCLFGHTHRPLLDTAPDLTIMNPGSLGYPRQEGRRFTYGVIEPDKGGRPAFCIRQL